MTIERNPDIKAQFAAISEVQQVLREQGSTLELQLAASEEDVQAVKQLDDEAFGGHHGVSLEELTAIQEHGAIVMMKDETGKLVGETQLLISQIPELKYQLKENEIYGYGTAVDPKAQGQGIGFAANGALRALARAEGKDTFVATVRVENYASLKMCMKLGCKITSYDPEFYDTLEHGGARVIVKGFTEMAEPPDVEMGSRLSEGVVYTGGEPTHDWYRVQVSFGDDVDVGANKRIADLVNAGYEGVWINREAGKEKQSAPGYIIFRRKPTAPASGLPDVDSGR